MEVTQKFFAKNDAGDIVFNIELKDVDTTSKLSLNCSIGIDFEKNPGMKYLMEKLSSPATNPQSKAFMVQEILSSIKTMEAVKNSINDTDGVKPSEVLNGTERVLIMVTTQDETGEFVSIAEPRNAFHFKDVVNMLAGCVVNLEKIDRSDFEKIIAGQADLEEEYVDCYSSTALFYTTAVMQRNKCYRFFIMQRS